uniref:Sleeping Beauty transposase HTH domain-containing protein n=1 Tax=Pundamilia nyererei TaxID=303518 RepID=A0A3B4GK03_9CICH
FRNISKNLRETAVAAHQSGEGYKTISSQPELHHCTVRKIIHKWKTFKSALSVVGSEVTKNVRIVQIFKHFYI